MTTLGEVRAQEDWARVKAAAGTTRRRGSLYGLVKQLVKGHNAVAANTGIRLRRLECEVLEPLPSMSTSSTTTASSSRCSSESIS